MRILVTGATGLVGIHVVNRLLELNCEVNALIRPSSNKALIQKKDQVLFHYGDILDERFVNTTVKGMDAIIHCAARTTFSKKNNDSNNIKNYEENVQGTKHLAEAAKNHSVRQFIYLSSCSAMGDLYNGERNELHSPTPDSEYGRSKLEGEILLLDYGNMFNLNITILRPGLIYGPYDRNGMKVMIEYIDKNKFFILGDGKNFKSLLSVHNLVNAIMCVLFNSAASGQIFIVTDGINYSLNEIVKKISSLLGKEKKILHIPAKLALAIGVIGDVTNIITRGRSPISSNDVKKMCNSNTYDITKIVTLLNYKPTMTLDQGLAEEVAWYKTSSKVYTPLCQYT